MIKEMYKRIKDNYHKYVLPTMGTAALTIVTILGISTLNYDGSILKPEEQARCLKAEKEIVRRIEKGEDVTFSHKYIATPFLNDGGTFYTEARIISETPQNDAYGLEVVSTFIPDSVLRKSEPRNLEEEKTIWRDYNIDGKVDTHTLKRKPRDRHCGTETATAQDTRVFTHDLESMLKKKQIYR